MPKKFISKGKGPDRKVIPISDRSGSRKPQDVVVVAFAMEGLPEKDREFESTKEYVYDELDDVSDFIDSTYSGMSQKDIQMYPGLEKIKNMLKDAYVLSANAMKNAGLLMQKHGGGVGPLVQSIHNAIVNTEKLNYNAYVDLEDLMKKSRKKESKEGMLQTFEGYSLNSIGADLQEINDQLQDIDAVLMRSFRDMRREHYREYRKEHPITVMAGKPLTDRERAEHFKVIGDRTQIFDENGKLILREFARD